VQQPGHLHLYIYIYIYIYYCCMQKNNHTMLSMWVSKKRFNSILQYIIYWNKQTKKEISKIASKGKLIESRGKHSESYLCCEGVVSRGQLATSPRFLAFRDWMQSKSREHCRYQPWGRQGRVKHLSYARKHFCDTNNTRKRLFKLINMRLHLI